MELLLDVRNLTLKISSTLVLQDIAFHLIKGECVALLGLNGAGKSTLIKTVLHLIPDAEGTIFINQVASSNLKARKEVVYLPEKFTANPYLTGKEYLATVLQGKMDAVTIIAHTIRFDPKHLQQKIATYSKGMIQKLGLLYFFSSDKTLKIADEIMSGLDFQTRVQVQNLIQVQQSQGKTFLFSTHMMEDVKAIATRVLYLNQGALEFDGSKETFLNSRWALCR